MFIFYSFEYKEKIRTKGKFYLSFIHSKCFLSAPQRRSCGARLLLAYCCNDIVFAFIGRQICKTLILSVFLPLFSMCVRVLFSPLNFSSQVCDSVFYCLKFYSFIFMFISIWLKRGDRVRTYCDRKRLWRQLMTATNTPTMHNLFVIVCVCWILVLYWN